MGIIYQTKVIDGKFSPLQREELSKSISGFKGRTIVLTLTHFRKPRNNNQNARHWARMTWLANELGYETKEEMHQVFQFMFLVDNTGKLPKVKSTKLLNEKEFSEFEENIDITMAKMGVVIPEPQLSEVI